MYNQELLHSVEQYFKSIRSLSIRQQENYIRFRKLQIKAETTPLTVSETVYLENILDVTPAKLSKSYYWSGTWYTVASHSYKTYKLTKNS